MDYYENFKWLNEGEIKIEEDKIVIKAPPFTDFFCGGDRIYEHLSIEHRTVKNIRVGD